MASLGSPGAAWLAALPTTLRELEETWSVGLGRPLPGGSASYVVAAVDADGHDRVVKVAVPGESLGAEARLLQVADGRGYARLFGHDEARGALLLEALGPSLDRAALSPPAKLDALATTLAEAWTVPLAAAPATPFGDRARTLHRLISTRREHGAGHPRALTTALAYAEHLADTAGNDEVVVHGDCHPANLLRSQRPGPAYLFVDPDGFRAEREYDAGVACRDWLGQLDVARPRAVIEAYAEQLADRLGLDAQRVWEWSLLERVSTGLYVTDFGAERLGRQFLDSAERLLDR